jgi:hypothetical protein
MANPQPLKKVRELNLLDMHSGILPIIPIKLLIKKRERDTAVRMSKPYGKFILLLVLKCNDNLKIINIIQREIAS